MTYNLLIVDDEPIICRGLTLTIPWKDYGIKIAGSAYDGSEAMEKITELQNIDILITDVQMPVVDGLELAEWIKDNHPHISIIMISGYDEFSYAKQALQSGVQDYLLKPVVVDELLQVITKTTEKIKVRRNSEISSQRTRLENAIYQQILDTRFEKTDHSGEIGTEEIVIFPFLSLIDTSILAIEEMSEEEVVLYKEIWKQSMELCLKTTSYEAVSIYTNKNILLTCLIQKDPISLDHFRSFLQNFSFHPALSFVLSYGGVKISHLRKAYEQLIESIRYLPLSEGNVITVKNAEQPVKRIDSSQSIKQIMTAIDQGNENIEGKIDEIFYYLSENQADLKQTIQVYSDILLNILSRYEKLFNRKFKAMDEQLKEQIDESLYNSNVSLKRLFTKNLTKMYSYFGFKQSNNSDWLINRAEQYIQIHYTSLITAQEVAEHIQISPNYFSTLFKQGTGRSFNEYINQLRIGNAKILLEETLLRVNEIADKVGYQEYKYFVEVFKKLTSLTPTQYRKLVSSKQF